VEGQQKLKESQGAADRAGGSRRSLGLYLSAAGVCRLGLVDFDVVDFTTFRRQVIHSTAERGPAEDRFRGRPYDGHQSQRHGG